MLLSAKRPTAFWIIGILWVIAVMVTYILLYRIHITKAVLRVYASLSFILVWTVCDVAVLTHGLIKRMDRDRARFIRSHFNADAGATEHYGLMVNTGSLSTDEAAEVIIDAYLRMFR